jgi:3-hydroxyisobutyrate dehydrogenase-like beta-hydroxyacid dehydrogenase
MTGRVGFVGLGNIGKPIAARLVAWPAGLTVYDVAPDPLAELEKLGAEVAGSVAELAGSCDLICVMVRDDDQVREVVGEIFGTARPGTTIAIHSTVSPDLPFQLAEVAQRHDLMLVDAPVSGGAMGADQATLAILVGGTDAAFAACQEPFALMGSEIVHCGPAGAGTSAKLARNLLHFVAFTAVGEAQRLAEAAGIDLVALGRVVRHTDAVTGGPGAIMHRNTTAPLAPDDGWTSIFTHVREIGEKDLAHAIELADRLGVDVPMARFAEQHLAAALGLPTQEGVATGSTDKTGSTTGGKDHG